jgi:hypothetical protein
MKLISLTFSMPDNACLPKFIYFYFLNQEGNHNNQLEKEQSIIHAYRDLS